MSDDFPTLRPIAVWPVALNLAAWSVNMKDENVDAVAIRERQRREIERRLDFQYPETGTGKLNFVPEPASHPAHWIPYRGHWITFDPPPIPSRNHDWQWWHDDYDGAPDAHDYRRGSAPSLEEAKRQIDEQIEESEDDFPRAEERA